MSTIRTGLVALALLPLAAGALTACSSSARTASTPPSVTGSTTAAGSGSGGAAGGSSGGAGASVAAAAASASTALGLGSGGSDDETKLCAAVPTADVQKLAKADVGTVSAALGECNWAGGGITLDIYTDDANKQYYNGGGITNGTALSGVGDVAQWQAPVPNMTAPNMAAHQGSLTLTITIGLDVADTSLAYTGTSPFYSITPAATQQYVAEEAQICKDVFAAAG